MKATLFSAVVASFFFASQLKAQTTIYHPFPESNAMWNVLYEYYDEGEPLIRHRYSYFMNGDSVIAGTTYHKIFYADTCASGVCTNQQRHSDRSSN